MKKMNGMQSVCKLIIGHATDSMATALAEFCISSALIGIEFSKTNRNVVGLAVETLSF